MFGFGKPPVETITRGDQKITRDPSGFLKAFRPGQWSITADVTAEVWENTDDATLETEADAKAYLIEGLKSGFISVVFPQTITNVRAVQHGTMYLVCRNGEDIQTSEILPGDKPREAIASDFW